MYISKSIKGSMHGKHPAKDYVQPICKVSTKLG